MDEFSPGPASPTTPERVGDALRAARETAGLSLAEVASRTRVPLRHLLAIENNDYSALPSPTYANGFAKAYARAVNLDEVAIGRQVRGELAGITRPPAYQPVEATDPDRVPSRGLTIVAVGLAIAVLILSGLYFGTTLFRGGVTTAATPAVAEGVTRVVTDPLPVATPTGTLPVDGQVVVTATEPVSVRIYDGERTLHQGTLQPGQSVGVPDDAGNPMIEVARPDHLRFTLNGSALTGLDLGDDPIEDVRVSAAALTARVDRARGERPSERATERRRETPERRAERPRVPARVLTETQRANLEAARNLPAPRRTQ